MIDVPTRFPFPPKSSSAGVYTLDIDGYHIGADQHGYEVRWFGTPIKFSSTRATCDARTNAQRALEWLRDHIVLTSQE